MASLSNPQLEMKFHFAFAGLTGELTHTLAFTSKFSIPEIKKDFIFHFFLLSGRASQNAIIFLCSPGAQAEIGLA